MRGLFGMALALLLAAASASAQQADATQPPEARCITVAAGEPDAPTYPSDQFKREERGAVQVLLEFGSPDTPPRATVLERTDPVFAEAVLAHVKALRVPCKAAGSPPVQLIRDYVFKPDDRRVRWFSAVDANAAANTRAWRCLTHRKAKERPDYPRQASQAGLQGRVVAQIRFESADQAPVVKVHARPSASLLAEAVEYWLSDARLPCHPGHPVTMNVTYEFMLEGEPAYGLKSVPFRALLGSTVGIERQTLAFDTTTMGCPFDLKLRFRQPMLMNLVGEVGERHPARRPLLEWLETVQLKLPERSLDSIFGDDTTVHVPCIRVDLKPKE